MGKLISNKLDLSYRKTSTCVKRNKSLSLPRKYVAYIRRTLSKKYYLPTEQNIDVKATNNLVRFDWLKASFVMFTCLHAMFTWFSVSQSLLLIMLVNLYIRELWEFSCSTSCWYRYTLFSCSSRVFLILFIH